MNKSGPKFSVKNDLVQDIPKKVKLLHFGSPSKNDFGGLKYEGDCEVDGVYHLWTLSENMKANIEKAGFKEGDTFMIKKWYKDTKTGYNYIPLGDVTVQPQNLPAQKPWIEEGKFPEPKNDTQERIIKGMCFNNACTLLTGSGLSKAPSDILGLSKNLYSEMKDWLIS